MKQKIAFCIQDMVIGGVETVFVGLLEELLKQKDIEIVVVTHAKIREPLYIKWFEEHPDVKVYVYRPLSNWFEDLKKYCSFFPLKQLRKLLFSLYKKYRRVFMWATRRLADVDIFVDYKNFEFFKELKYFNKPKIVWLHGALSYFEKNNLLDRSVDYDKIIVLTYDFVEEFSKKYPEYRSKVYCIRNALNRTAILAKAGKGERSNEEYFSHVSRLADGKDIITVLDAFELFYNKYPNVKLYIVGDGDKADSFKSYARKLKANKNIIFTGSLDNPYGIMQGAIANILSSESEGLPTVCIEAQILSVPVIASNCKFGPREILEDGRSGLLFSIGDVLELSDCMEKVYTDKNLVNNLVASATKSLYRFYPGHIVKDFMELISVYEKQG